jgi:curli biogenesis system outer membrane secretion channel CsgG
LKLMVEAGLVLALVGPALAQTPEAAQAQPKRVKLAVMSFDYGTITDHWWGQQDIGKGMADQVVDGLVNDGSVSVIERRNLDTVLAEQDFEHSDRSSPSAAALSKLGKLYGIRYIVAGSITKFGSEQKNYSAGAAGAALGPIGMFGFKKAKTEVGLTARLIEVTTGEIVVSARGEGLSKKGGGLSVGGIAKLAGGAALSMGSDDYKASAIGEAQDRACQQLVQELLAKVANLTLRSGD